MKKKKVIVKVDQIKELTHRLKLKSSEGDEGLEKGLTEVKKMAFDRGLRC